MEVPQGHSRRGWCGEGPELPPVSGRSLCSSPRAGLRAQPGAAEQEGRARSQPGQRFQKAKAQCIPIFQNRKNKTNQSRCSNM